MRSLVTSAAALFLGAGMALATATPAAAGDPPDVSATDACGVMTVIWEDGVLADDEWLETAVKRNGVVIDEFTMGPSGERDYGAVDGDEFEVLREGLAALRFTHAAPDGCVAPDLRVVATSECFGLEITVTNTGTVAIPEVVLTMPVVAPENLGPLAVGAGNTVHPRVPDDFPFAVLIDEAIYFTGRHHQPEGCSADAAEVAFTDTCDGAKVTLENSAKATIRVDLRVNGAFAQQAALLPETVMAVAVEAEPGDLIEAVIDVAAAEVEVIGSHTVGDVAGCPTPDAPPGPDLPKTGPATTLVLAAGGVLLVGGLALFLLARRRRLRLDH